MTDNPANNTSQSSGYLTRRDIVVGGAMVPVAIGIPAQAPAAVQPPADVTEAAKVVVNLTVNGTLHTLSLDPRTTLLDLLREHLDLTGTKKGCDQG
jgi:xanthine dehydrogenase YagT iron-sulfur-binding subunit